MVARTPDKCGDPYNTSWAFRDTDFRHVEETEEAETRFELKETDGWLERGFQQRAVHRHVSFPDPSDERASLILHSNQKRRRRPTPNNLV